MTTKIETVHEEHYVKYWFDKKGKLLRKKAVIDGVLWRDNWYCSKWYYFLSLLGIR